MRARSLDAPRSSSALARGSEQDGVDERGRVQSQDIEDRGDGEDHVKVGNVEDLIASRVEPLLAGLAAASGQWRL
jgi:hypothetical protein